MTDRPESPLTPEQEDEVRALLADARHDEPMPPDVAARMDRVLDDLASEPARQAPVVDLATRRRRVASLLVAAAAVVVVGVGIGQVVGAGGGSDDDAGSATSADSQAQDGGANAEGGDTSKSEVAPSPQTARGQQSRLLSGKTFEVDPDDLSRDIRRVQKYTQHAAAANDAQLRDGGLDAAVSGCPTRGLGSGTFVSIRYGDQPAILVLRPPEGDTQVADVYLCGSRDAVRSLTLRIPPP